MVRRCTRAGRPYRYWLVLIQQLSNTLRSTVDRTIINFFSLHRYEAKTFNWRYSIMLSLLRWDASLGFCWVSNPYLKWNISSDPYLCKLAWFVNSVHDYTWRNYSVRWYCTCWKYVRYMHVMLAKTRKILPDVQCRPIPLPFFISCPVS